MGTPTSLVLITVDCLRADHVGFLGYGGGTTPFADSLATQSWVFRNTMVAGAPTYYSFPAILASRYPLALGRDVIGLAPDEPTLASTLKAAGYATACFSAANPYISRQFGYDQGFDTFRDFLEEKPRESGNAPGTSAANLRSRTNRRLAELCRRFGLSAVYEELYFQYLQRVAAPSVQSLDTLRPFPSADVVVDQARAWLASNGRGPFFLWLHLMDAHAPYYPVKKAFDLLGRQSITPFGARYLNAFWNRGNLGPKRFFAHRQEILSLYDACVRWVDTQVERLAGALRQLGVWENCALAFTADHGEEFLDHGGRYHAPHKLSEELVHVPLLVRVPGAKPRTVDSVFSMIHLAPTILGALGISVPAQFRGNDLSGPIEQGAALDTPAIAECISGCTNPFSMPKRMGPRLLAVRDKEYKLVIDLRDSNNHLVMNHGAFLFNLKADPRERKPISAGAMPEVARPLWMVAREHVESAHSRRNTNFRLGALLREVKRTIQSREMSANRLASDRPE